MNAIGLLIQSFTQRAFSKEESSKRAVLEGTILFAVYLILYRTNLLSGSDKAKALNGIVLTGSLIAISEIAYRRMGKESVSNEEVRRDVEEEDSLDHLFDPNSFSTNVSMRLPQVHKALIPFYSKRYVPSKTLVRISEKYPADFLRGCFLFEQTFEESMAGPNKFYDRKTPLGQLASLWVDILLKVELVEEGDLVGPQSLHTSELRKLLYLKPPNTHPFLQNIPGEYLEQYFSIEVLEIMHHSSELENRSITLTKGLCRASSNQVKLFRQLLLLSLHNKAADIDLDHLSPKDIADLTYFITIFHKLSDLCKSKKLVLALSEEDQEFSVPEMSSAFLKSLGLTFISKVQKLGTPKEIVELIEKKVESALSEQLESELNSLFKPDVPAEGKKGSNPGASMREPQTHEHFAGDMTEELNPELQSRIVKNALEAHDLDPQAFIQGLQAGGFFGESMTKEEAEEFIENMRKKVSPDSG